LSKAKSVLRPPFTSFRSAVTGTVGFTGIFDPEDSIECGVSDDGTGLFAEPTSCGVAPLVICGWTLAITAGVDDHVESAGELANLVTICF
jgi:hypothetical protein